MSTGTVLYFIVLSFWLPDGNLKTIGGGRFAEEAECARTLAADLKAKSDLAGIKGRCEASSPKPAGLPETQPHVPAKVDA